MTRLGPLSAPNALTSYSSVPPLLPAAQGYRVQQNPCALVVVLGESPGCAMPVVSFSPERVFVSSRPSLMPLDDSAFRVALISRRGKHVTARGTWGATDPETGAVEIRLCELSPELGYELLCLAERLVALGDAEAPETHAPMREEVETTVGAREVLDVLSRNKCSGVVRQSSFMMGTLQPLSVSEDGTVSWHLDGPVVAAPFTVEVVGYNSLYTLEIDQVLGFEGSTLRTALPVRVVRSRHRFHRRAAALDGTTIEFRHPSWPTRIVNCSVEEVSFGGLSLVASLHDVLYPGLAPDYVRVTLPSGTTLHFTAEIRSSSSLGDDRARYGVRLHPLSDADANTWHEMVAERLTPTTRVGNEWGQEIWDLYGRAGYFSLSGRSPEQFEKLGRAFDDTSRAIYAAPEIGCHVAWPDHDGSALAALSMLKTYTTSWFGFQMAKVSGEAGNGTPGRIVLRDIHTRAYEHAQRDPDLRWLIAIPQVKKVWSRLVHHDLPERYIADGRACVVRFRALAVPCNVTSSASMPSADGFDVGPATPEELEQVFAAYASTRPRCYVEALDLVPERANLGELSAAWGRVGLSRSRTILVARRRGRVAAAAVLESADEGLHLFGLLDATRLLALTVGGEVAFGALLRAAQPWYASQGKESFVYYAEGDPMLPQDAPEGIEDLGLADYTILAAELLPELLEHVVNVTAPRAVDPTVAAAA